MMTFIALLFAAGAVMLLLIAYGAMEGQRYEVDEFGDKVPVPSDVEQFIAPLFGRFTRTSSVSRQRALFEMQWAGLEKFTPEFWTLLPFLIAPAGLIGGVAIGIMANLAPQTAGLLGVISAFMGATWPRNRKNGAITRRNELVREDTPRFISTFARIYVTFKDTSRTFEAMLERALRSRIADSAIKDPKLERQMPRRVVRRLRGRSGYESPIWTGLERLISAQRGNRSIVDRDMSTTGRADPITEFAFFCNDPDMTRFIQLIRENWVQDRRTDPDQIDEFVKSIQARRIQEIRQSFAKMQAEATTFLVLFNFPVLMGVIFMPLIGTLVGGN